MEAIIVWGMLVLNDGWLCYNRYLLIRMKLLKIAKKMAYFNLIIQNINESALNKLKRPFFLFNLWKSLTGQSADPAMPAALASAMVASSASAASAVSSPSSRRTLAQIRSLKTLKSLKMATSSGVTFNPLRLQKSSLAGRS